MANDALILFVIMLGCVLITAVICWFIWARARNALEIELTTIRVATERELAELSSRCKALEEAEHGASSALSHSEEERGKLEQRCAELSQELKDVTGQLADANSELVDLRLALKEGRDGADPDAAAADGSAPALADLKAQLTAVQSELADLIIDRDDWRGRYESLASEYQAHGHGANAEELNHLREQLAESLERCKALKIALEERKAGDDEAMETTPPEAAAAESEAPEPVVDSRAETLARIAARSDELDFDRIGRASEDESDDLTRIKGVGPFVQRKLNALGIFTYAQIARFTATDEDRVNDAIEFFPGRIRRDDWTGQAQRLLDQGE